jgi:hypothetical protein
MGLFKTRLRQDDLVEVLPIEEIHKTLDSRGRCQNLMFMSGMEIYAGNRYRVFKKVRTVFDERAWNMVRLKDTVILQNVICDGKDLDGVEQCHRRCFYYWKEKWLRNVT